MLVSDLNYLQPLVPDPDVTLTPEGTNLNEAGKRHFTLSPPNIRYVPLKM